MGYIKYLIVKKLAIVYFSTPCKAVREQMKCFAAKSKRGEISCTRGNFHVLLIYALLLYALRHFMVCHWNGI